MNTRDFDSEIRQAETDLAFALAQGDGYAEDAAAERIAAAKRDRDAWNIGQNVGAEAVRIAPDLV